MVTPWHLRQATRILHAGGVIAYPTETVYGLGCDPLDEPAVQRILQLKKRPEKKGLILIGATLDQLLPFIDDDCADLLAEKIRQSERPTTWVCPKHTETPKWLSGQFDSIAVRLTNNPTAKTLCESFGGAIVSTSANPAGLVPANNALMLRRYFQDKLDYFLIGDSMSDRQQPSRIVELVSEKVLRK